MIQKFFEKNFFAQKVSKWSNSKSYHVKSEIWRPSKFFLLPGHPGSTLRNFFEKFFEKKNSDQKVSKWSNSKSYHVKSEIWRPSNFFYYQAILVFIENGQNAVQRSLYLENSYENTIKGTAITTITATISFQFNFKYNSSHYLSSGVQGSSLVIFAPGRIENSYFWFGPK